MKVVRVKNSVGSKFYIVLSSSSFFLCHTVTCIYLYFKSMGITFGSKNNTDVNHLERGVGNVPQDWIEFSKSESNP